MTQPTIDLQINPADEAIRLEPLTVRFLITGENSTGTLAAFEVVVPGGQRLAAPAHSHDHYEETIYGLEGALTCRSCGSDAARCPRCRLSSQSPSASAGSVHLVSRCYSETPNRSE